MTQGVYKRTLKHRLNLSKSWDYNKHFTPVVRLKLSQAKKGIKLSEEHKNKMSKSKKGKKMSTQHRINMIKSLTGRKLSEEHKQNVSKSKKGIKLSEEHKLKIKLNHAKYWKGKKKSDKNKIKVIQTWNLPSYKTLAKERRKKQILPINNNRNKTSTIIIPITYRIYYS